MTATNNFNNSQFQQCRNCEYDHAHGACPTVGKTCMACQKTGHFANVCRSKPQAIHEVQLNEMEEHNREPDNQTAEIDEPMTNLFVGQIKEANNGTPDLWFTDVCICDDVVHFKLDTGSEANILPTRTYNKIQAMLFTFSGHHIKRMGKSLYQYKTKRSSSRWSLNVRPFWEKQRASNSSYWPSWMS